jgi:pimeloyl-ACP methyl ester carboxylesterase
LTPPQRQAGGRGAKGISRRWRALGVAWAALLLLGAGCMGIAAQEPAQGVAAGSTPGTARAATATPTPAPSPTVTPSPTPAPTATPDPRGSVLERRPPEGFQREQVNQVVGRLYPAGTSLPARYAVDRHLIRYYSTDEAGAPLEIVAQLFVPRLEGQGGPAARPVLVYGAGTTGLGDHCAPSREQPAVRNWGDYLAHGLSYAGQGYITVLPDYAGFNDEGRLQRYFIADVEGRVLLDAARAVNRFLEETPAAVAPEPAVFFGGYSQGGHAAMAVRDMAPSYAPEVPIKGVIGHGASTDVAALLRDSPYFAPYVLYSYADYYGREVVDVSRLLLPRWLPTLGADVTSRCIDAMPAYYGNDARQLYAGPFLDALYNGRLSQTFPALHDVLERNSTGLVPSEVPVLLLQGTADPIVPSRTQQAFVDRLCAAGSRVTYRTYASVHHFQTRQVSFKDTLAWMEEILAGRAPRSTCAGP